MNGIIHNCTHGNDPSTKLTEGEMILRVFNYLDRLVQIVQPRQLLFMAIDGAGGLLALASARAAHAVLSHCAIRGLESVLVDETTTIFTAALIGPYVRDSLGHTVVARHTSVALQRSRCRYCYGGTVSIGIRSSRLPGHTSRIGGWLLREPMPFI